MTAPAELVIEVTADDIRLGKPHDACLCPIARAIARLLGADDVAVGLNDMCATFLPGDLALTERDLPVEAARFIADFDDGRPVAPFTFTARLTHGGAS